MVEMLFTNFSNMTANKFIIIILVCIGSLEIFSQGFPLNRLELIENSSFDYIMNYDIVTKVRSDTVNQEIPVSYLLTLPYSVSQNINSEYQLNLKSKNFNLKIESPNTEDLILNYDKIKDETKIKDPSKIFSSQINIDTLGRLLEHSSYSEYPELNEIIKIVNTYSTGIFLEMPEGNPESWQITKPIEFENNGINLKYITSYDYQFSGVFEVQREKYYRVDYKVIDFKVDTSNEIAALYNRLMESFFDLEGYYLIDMETGKTFQNYSKGSIRTMMDLGEFEALVNPEKSYTKSNLLLIQIYFEGNSFLR